jgi:metallophosphoesterase (TIGR00282 family)
LFIGDICGDTGVKAAGSYLRENKYAMEIDIVVANAENAAARGTGLSKQAAAALMNGGVDVITLGNHTFRDRDIFELMDGQDRIIRPANYPEGAPGKGAALFFTRSGAVGVINILGRLYMDSYDCPFAAADREIAKLSGITNMIIVDVHAEATSEKRALACHCDGRCSLMAGTHTHVQTADEQIMPNGTAFITDAGMTGPACGVIGVKSETAIRRFRTLIPERFTPAEGRGQINAVIVDVDEESGRATSIARVNSLSDGIF